jgi:hypothetical protein
MFSDQNLLTKLLLGHLGTSKHRFFGLLDAASECSTSVHFFPKMNTIKFLKFIDYYSRDNHATLPDFYWYNL